MFEKFCRRNKLREATGGDGVQVVDVLLLDGRIVKGTYFANHLIVPAAPAEVAGYPSSCDVSIVSSVGSGSRHIITEL